MNDVYRGEFELSWNNRQEVLKLPVNPESPEIEHPGNNVNHVTTEVGTFKAIGEQGLTKLSLKGFFPNRYYTFCTYRDFPSPEECVAMIRRWQASRRPIRLIITGVLNDAFAIENFSFSKEVGTGDVNYVLELEQYRFANAEQGVNHSFADKMFTIVTLSEDMSLRDVAEEWLGDSDRYKEIASLNGIEDAEHPYAETEKDHHQIQVVCEEGTPGYDRLTRPDENGKGYG